MHQILVHFLGPKSGSFLILCLYFFIRFSADWARFLGPILVFLGSGVCVNLACFETLVTRSPCTFPREDETLYYGMLELLASRHDVHVHEDHGEAATRCESGR